MLHILETRNRIITYMKNRITLIATLKLIENKEEELTQTVKEIQAHCLKTEKGMLQYDWYLSESTNTIKVLETYTDSDAVLFHFDNYKPFTAALSQSREFVNLEVYGNASEALKHRVKKINAEIFGGISHLNKLS